MYYSIMIPFIPPVSFFYSCRLGALPILRSTAYSLNEKMLKTTFIFNTCFHHGLPGINYSGSRYFSP